MMVVSGIAIFGESFGQMNDNVIVVDTRHIVVSTYGDDLSDISSSEG